MDFSHSHIVNDMAEINIQSEDIGNGHPKDPHLRKVATHLTVIAHNTQKILFTFRWTGSTTLSG